MPEADILFDLRLPAFLESLGDGPGNRLILVIREATHLGEPVGPEPGLDLPEVFHEARPIISGPGGRIVELIWPAYVAYSVIDESYAERDPNAPPHDGHVVHRLERSLFLDHLRRASFAGDQYPGPLVHHRIVTGHHVVDLVSAQPPDVRMLEAAPGG